MRYQRSPTITRRHDRLIKLIPFGKFSSRELARKLKVSEQTIYRNINFLRERGFSIRSEKYADGWAYHLLAKPTTVSTRKGDSRK